MKSDLSPTDDNAAITGEEPPAPACVMSFNASDASGAAGTGVFKDRHSILRRCECRLFFAFLIERNLSRKLDVELFHFHAGTQKYTVKLFITIFVICEKLTFFF
ncbi:MAG: hypothetical protein HC794_06930 [Nitrospiraceae bacterium]|nr:hypothetical protein [Nitrospiraceae bacterium]